MTSCESKLLITGFLQLTTPAPSVFHNLLLNGGSEVRRHLIKTHTSYVLYLLMYQIFRYPVNQRFPLSPITHPFQNIHYRMDASDIPRPHSDDRVQIGERRLAYPQENLLVNELMLFNPLIVRYTIYSNISLYPSKTGPFPRNPRPWNGSLQASSSERGTCFN